MRISIPLTSKARKQAAVIQWVNRTTEECRRFTIVAGATEAEVGAQTESAIWKIVARFAALTSDMLRSTLLHLSEQRWLRHWMENSAASRKMTARFVAGRALSDGIDVLKRLTHDNMLGTLDYLGENVRNLEEAGHSRDCYMAALDQIDGEKLTATVSLKLTQFGLDLSAPACRENIFALAGRAREMGTRIEIDMESTEYTDRTLALVKEVQTAFPGHVRAVIQAYLFRSEADIRSLSSLGIPVRLCKGAYREPAGLAYPAKADVDRNYVKLMRLLFAEGNYPAIASHDESIIQATLRHIQEQNIDPTRFEFQMLYGIRRDLQRQLVAKGFRLRLYVPYGDAWYPYFMRRLAERPANVIFLAKNAFRA
jgi:proline dehydrogenase